MLVEHFTFYKLKCVYFLEPEISSNSKENGATTFGGMTECIIIAGGVMLALLCEYIIIIVSHVLT